MSGTSKKTRSADKPSKMNKKNLWSDLSDSSKETELEKIRLRNLKEQEHFLRMMDIDAIDEFKEIKEDMEREKRVKELQRKQRPQKRNWMEEVGRRPLSTRIQNQEGSEVKKLKESSLKKPSESVTDTRIRGSNSLELEDEDSHKMLKELLASMKINRDYEPIIDLSACNLESPDGGCFKNHIMRFEMMCVKNKMISSRIHSLCFHPTVARKILFAGSYDGDIAIWDMESDIGENKNNNSVSLCSEWGAHTKVTNCLSISDYNPSNLYSTSHDGTFVRTAIEDNKTDTLYATDFHAKVKHLTWHSEKDASTIYLARGDGSVGFLDLRSTQRLRSSRPYPSEPNWFRCFKRSLRTIQFSQKNSNYFIASSGSGGCRIFDARQMKARRSDELVVPVAILDHKSGLTNAFFSSNGDRVVTASNDARIRIFNTEDLTLKNIPVVANIPHKNFSGSFLAPFKPIWYQNRDDVILVGSMETPRSIKILDGSSGEVLSELRDDAMETITPVIACHPHLPLIAGGDRAGRVFAFGHPSLKSE